MPRPAYTGKNRQLLLAFDVGTTFSGISYSILDPGKVPDILEVTTFPGQTQGGKNVKIPSVIYYSKDGEVRAIGAETERDDIEIMAEEEEWTRAEWFKLHLGPSLKKKLPSDANIPNLALSEIGKTALEIFADFLKYLNDAAKQYIIENHPRIGTNVWENGDIHYVLSHPNGWEGKEQSLLRQAAEKAGIITKESNDSRKVTFITEGEASLNHCIEEGLVAAALDSSGEGVVIVDAGGGTIDFSAYAYKSDGKTYEEIAESQCHARGSIFVTQEYAKKHFEERLKGTPYLEDIPQMLPGFDKSAKCNFRSPESPHFVSLGSQSRKLQDAKLGIRLGRLRIDGNVMASFFEPSVHCITSSVLLQIAHKQITNVFLVGGFSANDYLFQRVKEELEKHDLKVYRPNGRLNKVVSEGAILGVLDHPVNSRVTRFAYGVRCSQTYDPSDSEHVRRRAECHDNPLTGKKMLRVFDTILPRNAQVSESQEFRQNYARFEHCFVHLFKASEAESESTVFTEILCYEGSLEPHQYKYINEHSKFREVCKVKADVSELPSILCAGPEGPFLLTPYDIILKLGLTELQAQIAWIEDGVERRGPAEIIYGTNL